MIMLDMHPIPAGGTQAPSLEDLVQNSHDKQQSEA